MTRRCCSIVSFSTLPSKMQPPDFIYKAAGTGASPKVAAHSAGVSVSTTQACFAGSIKPAPLHSPFTGSLSRHNCLAV